ncbi:MAG: TVP38/TMEM64 family protein [Fusobacteriaceae bacterium]
MKKWIKLIAVIFIVAILVFALIKSGAIEYLKDREKMQQLIDGLGVWGPLVYIVLFTLVTLTCVSTVPIAVVGGLVFGPVLGIIYTAIGAGIGLSCSFLIARYLAKKSLEEKFGNSDVFKKINNGVKNDGWFILAVTRFLPIFPFGIQNYVYGLTPIGFVQYAILSTLFILPGISIFVILAGAIASGDMKLAMQRFFIACGLLLVLTILTKIIAKKSKAK